MVLVNATMLYFEKYWNALLSEIRLRQWNALSIDRSYFMRLVELHKIID